jgi:hypothetical protein
MIKYWFHDVSQRLEFWWYVYIFYVTIWYWIRKIWCEDIDNLLNVHCWKTMCEIKIYLWGHLEKNQVYWLKYVKFIWRHDRQLWRIGYDIPFISMPTWILRKWEMLHDRSRKLFLNQVTRTWWLVLIFDINTMLILEMTNSMKVWFLAEPCLR